MSQRSKNVRSRRLSQTQPNNSVYTTDDIVNDVVRYIIYRAGENLLFSKTELLRNVIHKNGEFDNVLCKANTILENVYGYKILQCSSAKGKEKMFAVTNLVSTPDSLREEQCAFNGDSEESVSDELENLPDDVNKILILLILSHILMCNNTVSDTSLYSFLKALDIDVDVKHPIFGKVRDYITKTLVKQHYLHCETDSLSKLQTFQWGSRAESEISKEEVLNFVCAMYKNKKPSDWTQQYKAAKDQFKNETDSS